MQFELTKIDGQNFIIQRVGKREFIRSPAEAVAIEDREIADGIAALSDAQAAATVTQQTIESALLAGEPTEHLRAQLVDGQGVIAGFSRDIAESKAAIREIFKMIDDSTANEIRTAASARLAALLSPHDAAIKEFA